MNRKKVYFASDFHLGAPDFESSLERERKIVQWLIEVSKDAERIYLVGDLFDFWFEYKRAVPRGFTRLLGTLARLTDQGIPIDVFIGNHDMWIFDYLPKETGVTLHREPITATYGGKKFYIGHGDGLGPGDYGYKFIKKVFSSKLCQWAFARLHPNFGIGLADFLSQRSRKSGMEKDKIYLGDDGEWLSIYSKEILAQEHFDYFVFGHRHLPLEIELSPNSTYVNLGDWINHFTYGEFDGEKLHLKHYLDKEVQ